MSGARGERETGLTGRQFRHSEKYVKICLQMFLKPWQIPAVVEYCWLFKWFSLYNKGFLIFPCFLYIFSECLDCLPRNFCFYFYSGVILFVIVSFSLHENSDRKLKLKRIDWKTNSRHCKNLRNNQNIVTGKHQNAKKYQNQVMFSAVSVLFFCTKTYCHCCSSILVRFSCNPGTLRPTYSQ